MTRQRSERGVPVGLEKVLYTAAIDPVFREALLRDREAAVQARGLALEGSELAMLRLAPEAQLASAIAALDTSEGNLARRGFMRAVAGAVTLAAGTVLTGCGEETIQGIRPSFESGGSRPDDVGWPERMIVADGSRPGDLGLPDRPLAADGIRPNDGSGSPDVEPDGIKATDGAESKTDP